MAFLAFVQNSASTIHRKVMGSSMVVKGVAAAFFVLFVMYIYSSMQMSALNRYHSMSASMDTSATSVKNISTADFLNTEADQAVSTPSHSFGNTLEESIVNKYYPMDPVPTDVKFKLRNAKPHMATI